MNELVPGHTTTWRDRPDRCPACGRPILGATSALPGPEPSPSPGSVSLCISCGALARYDESLRLRPLDPLELSDLQVSVVWSAIARMQAEIRARGPLKGPE